ncbi:MAG: response regulator [Candidatus Thiodiazotropha sp. (ex Ctena orbiculata)]|nr:response regulator [Candidatus Thiodiazotropha taylori]MBT2998375.1 response regulator [Candidatus Thiodiazotropha taylori]MBT3000334.1 response regulator [Candidatus Thiodiazotropha taylori]MBV2108434.1 response regulator [Candidatus Thiodiazotropha taylori]MBV2112893.1 response regulator [Candidatus Thiodiazotropha taylori]
MFKQQDPDGMAEQALNSFSHHTGDKPVVLIADDSRVVRVSLKNILKDDCQIIEAENGQDAWNTLCDTPSVALVFSDLSMPELDGRGLLSRIRSSESTALAKTPFIVVTGNEESEEIRQELAQLGADEVICKPFDPDNIKSYLSRLANRLADQETTQSDDGASPQQPLEPQSDYLEGMADREQFMVSTSRELAFAIRNKNELAIALVRIDQIDDIAAHYSEPAINHILHSLAEIINLHIHPDDTLAYFGKGLFAMLRPASNAIGTRYLGRRILEDLASKQFYLGESEQVISASIAISAPDIKPGTRLNELLSLAEGRLKTAIDNGGNKVVDKGNEGLSPVNLVTDTSELANQSVPSASNPTYSQSQLTRSTTEIQRLAAEQVAEIKARYGNDLDEQDDDADSELIEQQQTIERLTNENRQLINEIAHWKRQSAESDNLRRHLFEVESQLQQMQVKFADLQSEHDNLAQQAAEIEDDKKAHLQRIEFIENENNFLLQRAETAESESKDLRQRVEAVERENNLLLKRAETAESENKNLLHRVDTAESLNQALVMEEESHPNTGSETQHFLEEENRRLESQTAELMGRAEKAEAENVKSNQLVSSLEDNIKLLHMQLDQLQQELTEEKQKKLTTVSKERRVDRESSSFDSGIQTQSESIVSGNTQHSDLLLNPLPENISNRAEGEPNRGDSEPNGAESEPSSVHLFPDQDQIRSRQQANAKGSIPPFRVEPEPLLFKNGFNLSSFTIASIIFTVMLIVGGVYIYNVFTKEPGVEIKSEEARSTKDQTQSLSNNGTSAALEHTTIAKTMATAGSAKVDKIANGAVADEVRLKKERTLRMLAEEEFRIKSQQGVISNSQAPNPMESTQPISSVIE